MGLVEFGISMRHADSSTWHPNAASQELADPKFGLFNSYDGGRTLHPSPVSSDAQPDHLAPFELCARLAGLALLRLGFALLV